MELVVTMLKAQVSLLALLSVMFSLSLPAWSMEEEEGSEDRESQGVALTLTSIPDEVKEHIFSFLPGDVMTLRLTCRNLHESVSSPSFLRSLIKLRYLEKWKDKDEDGAQKQALSIFHVVNKATLWSRGQKEAAAKLCVRALFRKDSPTSQSRLIPLFLAGLLVEDQRLLSSEGLALKQPVEAKIKAAMESLFLDTGTYLPPYTYEPKKDVFFLRLYLSLSSLSTQNRFVELSNTTTVIVQERINSAMQSINDKDWEKKKIPSYLFGEMAFSPRLAYSADVKFQLLKAAENGEKSYLLAQRYHSDGKTIADKLFKLAAKQGHRVAQYSLGSCYSGEDSERAFYWYRAAEQGDADAQCDLASSYSWEQGGVKYDGERVSYWYKQAAKNGNMRGQLMTGYFCEIDGDLTEAIYWYQKAADQGSESAKSKLEELTTCFKNESSMD
jgi:hypothetical protein